jgi:hypothetical protein
VKVVNLYHIHQINITYVELSALFCIVPISPSSAHSFQELTSRLARSIWRRIRTVGASAKIENQNSHIPYTYSQASCTFAARNRDYSVVYASEIHAYKVHTCEMHTHEIQRL